MSEIIDALFMGGIVNVALVCIKLSALYLIIHVAVMNGMIDAYHKIEREKKEKDRRLYDAK